MTYRQLFDEAIGVEPPSSVDLDRVLAREGRRRRLRWIGASGVAAGAVLAVAVGAVTVAGAGAGGRTTPPIASAQAGAPGPVEDRAEQLRTAAVDALRREAPGLRWVPVEGPNDPGTRTDPAQETPSLSFGEFSHPAAGYGASAIIEVGGIRARLTIKVETPPADQADAWGRCRPETIEHNVCAMSTGPNGEQIRHWKGAVFRVPAGVSGPPSGNIRVPEDTAGHIRLAHDQIVALHDDGSYVTVEVQGLGEDAALTPEQLVAVAVDPALSAD